MLVIPPLEILENEDYLVSSSVLIGSGDDPIEWVSGATYTLGTRIRHTASKKIYECILDGSDTIAPDINTNYRWAEVSYINKYAMFDNLRDTQTVAEDTITIEIAPGKKINSLAILNMTNISGIYIKVQDFFYNTIYETIPDIDVTGKVNYLSVSLTPTSAGYITITLTGIGTIKVGAVVLGNKTFIGDIQSDFNVSTENFSIVERDVFGEVNIVRRRNVPVISGTLFILANDVPRVSAVRDLLNAVPAVWCGMEKNEIPEYYDSLVIFGFYRTFSIVLESSLHAKVAIELEEV